MTITGTHFKTQNPEILTQWAAFETAAQQWGDDVKAFHTRMGAVNALGGIRAGVGVVQALKFEGEPPARWKREGYGHAPYKNNPVREEFDGLTRTLLRVDGLDNQRLIEAASVSGSGRMMLVSPQIFEHDGTVYATYSDHEVELPSDAWESITPGAYTIARGQHMEADQ